VRDPDPYEIVIKVTTRDKKHCYYAHFTRDTHTLTDVYEYKSVYHGIVNSRIREVVNAARTRLDTIPAIVGDTQ
jgi:hypothetical protein